MNPAAEFAAAVIDATCAALAAAVIGDMDERGAPEGEFRARCADMRVRLQYLAEAVACERAGLYLDHVDWLHATHVARGLDPAGLRAAAACMRRVLAEDLSPAAFAWVAPILHAEEELREAPLPRLPGACAGAHAERVAVLLEHLLERRREAAIRTALEYSSTLGEETFVAEVLASLQRELGRLWQHGKIHVADEHLGSHVTEEILARLSARAEPRASIGRDVVVASSAGDLHDIGARMVARQFERGGWNVSFLGSNVPTRDLAQALGERGTDLLALSVSQGLHARCAAGVVAAAHALEPPVPVLVGGPPFRVVPDLWRVIGADAHAEDAPAAERAGLELVRRRRGPPRA